MMGKLKLKRSAAYVCVPVFIMMLVSSVCGQTRRGNAATARHKPVTIRSVDFLNRTYPAECADGSKVRVVNGKYAPPANSAGPYYELHVAVTYGDLTGDGQEEAVVIRTCDGAAGSAEDATIYSLLRGRLTPLVDLEPGSRGDGGDLKVKIAGGLLSVERNVGMAACCADLRETITYRLVGRKLSQVGKAVRRPLEPETKPTTQQIQFDSDRSRANIEGTLEARHRVDYLLRANQGQKLDVLLSAGESQTVMTVIDSDGKFVDEKSGYGDIWQGVLPATGEYRIIVENKDPSSTPKPASYTLHVIID